MFAEASAALADVKFLTLDLVTCCSRCRFPAFSLHAGFLDVILFFFWHGLIVFEQ